MLNPVDQVVAGVRCAVADTAPGRPEAVVFVHGNPGPMDDWEELLPAVAPLGRAVAIDMPGYGRADRPRDFDYTIDGYGRYLGAVLDHLGVQRSHLVLHDFGGAWGLRWAVEHPGRVGSMTFVNCGVLEGYRWHGFARVWQTPVFGELAQLTTTAWGLRRTLNALNPKPLPRAFTDRVWRYADWGHKRAVLKLYRASRHVGKAVPPLGPVADKPVCVIWGAADPFIEERFAGQQKRHFPRAEVHVLDGLGHWPFIDDADAVRRLLVAFLGRVVGVST